MIRNAWIALSLASVLAGCGAAQESEVAAVAIESVDSEQTNFESSALTTIANKLLPPGAEHIYFGSPSVAYVQDEQPYGYRFFTAKPGHEFKVYAFEDDGSGNHAAGQTVDFKLQRAVKKNGRWQWSVVAYGEHQNGSGSAVVRYMPPARSNEGLYLITAVATELPASITLSIGCRGGAGCATASQPGDSCGGRTSTPNACDVGLYCNYQPGAAQCGRADAPGTCAIRPEVCASFYAPVCGCDGRTYSNTCMAGIAGQGVLQEGACEAAVVGHWLQKLPGGARVHYNFSADGTFTSVKHPACMYTLPRCMVKLAPGLGHYSVLGGDVSLSYESPAFHTPTDVSFLLAMVKGTDRLTGEDYGETLQLTRDLN